MEPNAELAFEWYMKAADKGDMQSQVNVVKAYYLGTAQSRITTRLSSGIARLLSKGIFSHGYKWY